MENDLVFDSSTLVKYYNTWEKGSLVVKYWLDRHNKRKGAKKLLFYLPNICVGEIIKCIYEGYYVKKNYKFEPLFLNTLATFISDTESISDFDTKRQKSCF